MRFAIGHVAEKVVLDHGADPPDDFVLGKASHGWDLQDVAGHGEAHHLGGDKARPHVCLARRKHFHQHPLKALVENALERLKGARMGHGRPKERNQLLAEDPSLHRLDEIGDKGSPGRRTIHRAQVRHFETSEGCLGEEALLVPEVVDDQGGVDARTCPNVADGGALKPSLSEKQPGSVEDTRRSGRHRICGRAGATSQPCRSFYHMPPSAFWSDTSAVRLWVWA